MSSVFASVAVPLFLCMGQDSCQRVVFFGREEGMTSTGVVITMRTLLRPDCTDSGKKCGGEKKEPKGVAVKYEIYEFKLSYLVWFN